MRITKKGQVTIPKDIRESTGLLPGANVEFEISGNAVFIKKAIGSKSRGHRITEIFRGTGKLRMSTAEIMRLTRGE